MTEKKTDTTKDETKKVDETKTAPVVDVADKIKEEIEQEELPKQSDAIELPEDVRKRLEQNKAKKTEKKNKRKKKNIDKQVSVGIAHITATYNNTIVSLSDEEGNVLSWASAGIAGFKGPKKSTPYAAQIITKIAVDKAKECGLKEVSVKVKGVGTGRESAVRSLNANGLIVTSIKDITPIPHNGCRARKPRRV